MNDDVGNKRRYTTLCQVLDSLRWEAPSDNSIYHPAPGNADALIQARSRALLHLFLKARFWLVDFHERETFVTDGKHDGGIDAYFIDRQNKRIYLLQSKFRANAANFSTTNMSAGDLLKMEVKRILSGEKKAEQGYMYNDRIVKGLQKAVQKLPDAGSYTSNVVLLGNSKTYTPLQLKKLVDGYAIEQFDHQKIYSALLFPVINGTYFTDPDLTIEINLSNLRGETHLDYDVKTDGSRCNIKLLFVPTREVGRIMHTYKNSILKYNPRSFLELAKNSVNRDIAASIKNIESNEFALFNNGITILSDETSISSNTGKQGMAQIVLRNPQLVNGGQTAFTLSRVYEECIPTNNYSTFKGKEVLLRVITFVGGKNSQKDGARLALIGNISKASNSQTKIEDSDRRSNDEVQLKLQKIFFEQYGLYYERKRGEFSDGIHSKYVNSDLLINRERLIRVSLACEYKVNQARSSISKFFEESALADVLKVKNADKYAYGYEILRILERKRKVKSRRKGDRYHTDEFGQGLRYGQYAIVSVCANVGIQKRLSEQNAVEKILPQWKAFEAWSQKQPSNSNYKEDSSFDFVNYYKGATINEDLQNYTFIV